MYAAEIINEFRNGNQDILIDNESSTIDFIYNGVSHISSNWNLGKPAWLLPQLKDAVDKITAKELVLVRSAVIEGSEIPYLVFEPNDNNVIISMIVFDNYEIEQIFPSGPFAENKAELYSYFNANKSALYNQIDEVTKSTPGHTETFKGCEVYAGDLLENLEVMILEIEQLFV